MPLLQGLLLPISSRRQAASILELTTIIGFGIVNKEKGVRNITQPLPSTPDDGHPWLTV